jgi:hypothetical protein
MNVGVTKNVFSLVAFPIKICWVIWVGWVRLG